MENKYMVRWRTKSILIADKIPNTNTIEKDTQSKITKMNVIIQEKKVELATTT